jgi:hypothetical protein
VARYEAVAAQGKKGDEVKPYYDDAKAKKL